MTQLFLDAFLSNDYSGINGNLPKLGLSLLAIGFDILFMLQHYVFYRKSAKSNDDVRRPLIADSAA